MKKVSFIFGFLLLVVSALVLFSSTSNRYLVEGRTNLSSGKVAKAVEVLSEGLKKYPENKEISFTLAKALLLSGEVEKASELVIEKRILNTLKKNSSFQNFLVDLSEGNYRQGNEKYARMFGNEYLKCHDASEVSKKIVKNYIRIGQVLPEKSTGLWERAYNVANALKENELKETIRALLLPKYFQLAEELRLKKQYKEALDVLHKGEIIGKNADINYQEALIQGELGKIKLAQKLFEEAIQLEPTNTNYKIAYADTLKKAAAKTKDETIKKEYLEKAKLLLTGIDENLQKPNLLNKIINLNAKYKILKANLDLVLVGDYYYPVFEFKIKPVSNTLLRNYKVVFIDENKKKELDAYEAPITRGDLNQLIEITCRNPVPEGNATAAKLLINNEFAGEYTSK